MSCGHCGAELPPESRFCSWCGHRVDATAVLVDRPTAARGSPSAVTAVTAVAAALVLLAGIATAVRASPAPARRIPREGAMPAELHFRKPRPLARSTLRAMAESGARSLALNMAAGRDEAVQSILGGSRSIATSAHCSTRVVTTLLVPPFRRLRAAREEHRDGVALATDQVEPWATGTATAEIPEGVEPPTTANDRGEMLEASGIRVSVLLYSCNPV